ncbi:ATP-grasp domain-containing protein, partial [bacterium]|nr:ATP-grasp domain-containing protein [bacterium]
GRHPVLVDEYIQGKELEIDLVCDGKDVHIPGVMEHIERAGVHSGDSMALFPAPGLPDGLADEIADISRRVALALETVGMLNIQFIHDGERLFVLEVNPRASRTVPFLAKATGRSLARLATRAMLGVGLAEQGAELGLAPPPPMLALKAPVFSFAKLGGVEPGLGPEMKSTGEIMSFGESLSEVLAKTWLGLGLGRLGPDQGAVLITVADPDKGAAVAIARRLSVLGYRLYATDGTWRALESAGIEALRVAKISEGPPSLLDLLGEGRICLVVNSDSADREAETDGRKIRRASVEGGIPILTNVETALALVSSLEERARGGGPVPIRALQDIHA